MAINDIKKLEETVYCFGNYLIKDTANISDEFILTYKEYKTFYLAYYNGLQEKKIQTDYDDYKIRVKEKFNYFKRDFNNTFKIKSFDSFTFKEDKAPLISIAINYSNTENEKMAYFSFVIYKDKIKFLGTCRRTYTIDFDLYRLHKINEERANQFYKNYKEKYFEYSFFNAIPIKVKNKWGLNMLNGKEILKPIYDSIFPFISNFALVVKNKKYNLLSKDFKLIFTEEPKKIKIENGFYFVLNKNNKFISYPSGFSVGLGEPRETVVMKDQVSEMQEIKQTEITIKPPNEHSYIEMLLSDNYNIQKYSIGNNYNPILKDRICKIIDEKTKDTIVSLTGFSSLNAHNDFIFGYKNDTSYVIKPSGEILFKSHFICYYNVPGYVNIYNKSANLFGMYCPYTNVYIKPKYKYIKPIDRDKFFVVITLNDNIGYLDNNGKELF